MLKLERDKVVLELQVKSQQENVDLRIDPIRAKVAGEYQNLLHEQIMQGLATYRIFDA